jgi:OFA family oxalate/formate antiporter-like MFS transporter
MGLEEASGLLIYLAVGSLSLRLPMGFLADYLGRRRTLILILLSYATLVGLAALPDLASSTTYMRVHACAAGGFTGSFLTVVATVPSEVLAPSHRKLGTAAIFTPIGIGVIVGPILAGELVENSGAYTGAKLLSSACLVGASIFLIAASCVKRADEAA